MVGLVLFLYLFFIMLTETLPIYRDTFDLAKIVLDYVEKFPKVYKFTIGEQLIDNSLDLFEYLQLANKAVDDKIKRKRYLDNFLIKYETVKVLVRLCNEKKILSIKQFSSLAEKLNNIGKQATAWKNNT